MNPVEPEQILAHIRAQPRGRTSLKIMARELRLKGDRRAALEEALDRLVVEGRLFEGRSGHYRIVDRKTGYLPGRFSAHPAGFGFVVLDREVPAFDGDLYIPPDATADAMQGDRVLVEVVRVKPDRRAEGKVRSILHREQSLVVGRFHYDKHGSRVEPHDDRVRGEILIEPGKELPPESFYGERLGQVTPPRVDSAAELDGLIVTVAVHEFPTRFRPARGRVIEVLGDENDFGVDVEIMIRRFHIPYRFTEEALEEAKAIPDEVPEAEIARRRDFRDVPIVTIDGETARDFDDAIYVERLDGGWKLQVHIADVSHYVQPGSFLDRDARQRGTSVYFPDRAVPMLPASLSTGICSLNPDVDRLAMSALLDLSPTGELRGAEFCRSVIRSAARMTYTKVFGILEGDEALRKEYADLTPGFERMRDLAKALMAKRRKRGAIDLDLPEPVISFDDGGHMTGVVRSERNIAHRLIEELMLAANEAVASMLIKEKRELLHRVHESPSPKSLAELEQVARSFGHSLGLEIRERSFQRQKRTGRGGSKPKPQLGLQGDGIVSPKDLQKFIEGLDGLPEQRVLSFRLLRAMKQARYSEINKGHFALATQTYTHFTSPIRRYPDLMVHRALGAWIDGKEGQTAEELAAVADHASMTERRASSAERALVDWKKAKYMETRMGDEMEAMVVSMAEVGMWVELVDLFVEGFVPVEAIVGERYDYRENRRAMVGRRTSRKFSLGDHVRIRVDRIDWGRLRAELTCLGPWTPKSKTKVE